MRVPQLARCPDCPKIVVNRSTWARMTPEQRADPRFSRGTNGRCRRCYERWRRAEIKTLRGDLKFRVGRRWTTFCGCGCWIWLGEDCPNCKYELLVKAKAA